MGKELSDLVKGMKKELSTKCEELCRLVDWLYVLAMGRLALLREACSWEGEHQHQLM